MKRINITYHMKRDNEIAESSITLPMEDKIADDLLKNGTGSRYIQTPINYVKGMAKMGDIGAILQRLAIVQGYKLVGGLTFEEQEPQGGQDAQGIYQEIHHGAGGVVEEVIEGTAKKPIDLYYKMHRCLTKAQGDEALGCHVNNIIVHLAKSIESNMTWYDASYDAWCDYFLN